MRVKCLHLGGYGHFMFIYNEKFFQIKNVPNIPQNMDAFSENVMWRHNDVMKSHGRFT